MKNKRILTLSAVFIVLAAMIFTLSSCFSKKVTPAEYVYDAFEATFEGALDEDISSLLEAASEKGSVGFTFKTTDELKNFGLPIDSLSAKSYGGKKYGAAVLELTADGETVNAGIFAKPNELAVNSSLLGSETYGIKLDNLKDSYLKSIFADPNSKYSLVSVFGEKGEYFDNADDTAELTAKAGKLLEKYKALFIKLTNENSVSSLESEDGGKAVKIELTGENIKNIVKGVYEAAKTDTELRALVSEFVKALNEDGSIPSDPMKEYDEFFKDENKLNEALKIFDDYGIVLKLEMHTAKNAVIKTAALDASVTKKDVNETLNAKLSLDLSKEDKAVLEFKLDLPESAEESEENAMLAQGIKLIYEVTENTKDSAKSKLSFSYGAVTVEVLDLSLDKKEGTFKLSSAVAESAGAGKVSISGTYKLDKSELSLKISEVTAANQAIKLDVEFKILAKDSAPDYPENITDVFTLDEKGIDDILENVQKNISNLKIFQGAASPDYGF